jgi:FHA domain
LSIDDALLLGKIAFVAALYFFLLILALLLHRELKSTTLRTEERAPGDLLVIDPSESGFQASERIPLLALTRIGRDDGNDISFDDTYVSSEHARILWNSRGWVLHDLGSTNGTMVNGKPIRKAVSIKPGDTLEFGRVKTKLVGL